MPSLKNSRIPLVIAVLYCVSLITVSAYADTWIAVGNLVTAREDHAATLLLSGKVLIAGGSNTQSSLASTELYDPATQAWDVGGSMAVSRSSCPATLLSDGNVLIEGGLNDASSSSETYDPVINVWAATGNLTNTHQGNQTSTLLADGAALITGGFDRNGSFTASVGLYDPATESWSTEASLGTARAYHSATRLLSGKVLVAGGQSVTGTLSTAELYDPETHTWSATGNLLTARRQHTATLLRSGKILVVGGYGDVGGGDPPLSSAALYDPATGAWTATGSLVARRAHHTATLLTSGKVLVVGGYNDIDGALATAELFDPGTNTWSEAPSMNTARSDHSATLMSDGTVLVAGGFTTGWNDVLFTSELYVPSDRIFGDGFE